MIKRYYWVWIAFFIVLLDQVTKWLASAFLILYDPVPVMPLVNLTLAHNTGAAFSFLQHAGGWQFWFFIGSAVLVSSVIIGWLLRLMPSQRRLGVGLACVLGGAIGNTLDRLIHGYVIDFIDLYFQRWHFATFNVADIAISLGAFAVLIAFTLGET